MSELIKVSSASQEESLVLPGGMKLEIFNIENWKFEEAPVTSEYVGAVSRVVGKCKLDGFENLAYEWTAAEKDIEIFGNGDDAKWREYVQHSFGQALLTKKEVYLQQIKSGLNKAIGFN